MPLIRKELSLRKPARHLCIEPIGNGFKVKILPVIDLVANVEVDGLRVVIPVPDIAVFRHMAAEHRNIEFPRFLADGDAILLISKGSSGEQCLQSVNVPSPSGAELNHSTQRVVVVQGRRRASDHFDAAHEPGILHVET